MELTGIPIKNFIDFRDNWQITTEEDLFYFIINDEFDIGSFDDYEITNIILERRQRHGFDSNRKMSSKNRKESSKKIMNLHLPKKIEDEIFNKKIADSPQVNISFSSKDLNSSIDLREEMDVQCHDSKIASKIIKIEQKKKIDLKRDIKIVEIINNITGKFYGTVKNDNNSVCVLLKSQDVTIKKHNKKSEKLRLDSGTIIFINKNVQNKYIINFSNHDAIEWYFEDNVLTYIMKTIETRLVFRKVISKQLEKIKDISQYTKNKKVLGEGSFGKVFKTNIGNLELALKTITKDDKTYYFHEVYILQLLQKLINKKISPNIPFVYYFNFEPTNTGFFTELADGTFNTLLKKIEKYPYESRILYLEVCLFQLMAGLHTVQHYYQIWNYDIKKSNILYYKIQKGGYWKYKILGQDYYIPNLGFLLVLNDFGISQVLSPKYISEKDVITKSFGTRLATIRDNKFIPINIVNNFNLGENININWNDGEKSTGIKFSKTSIKQSLEKFPYFFNDVNVPPFEFYNDTQDMIRIFTGGVRASQNKVKELHGKITFCDEFINKLEPYLGKINDTRQKEKFFSKSPSQVVAGYFIKDFFVKYTLLPQDVKILETYKIS